MGNRNPNQLPPRSIQGGCLRAVLDRLGRKTRHATIPRDSIVITIGVAFTEEHTMGFTMGFERGDPFDVFHCTHIVAYNDGITPYVVTRILNIS